jgi:hypothetical protein
MTGSSWAGIITAFATLLTALGGLILALKTIVPMKREVHATHKIVNQDKTDRDNFNRALIRALESHGIEVPLDQSLPDAPEAPAT